jgi:DNA invertase Pin-like site-specific DNA recombinase
VFTDVASGAKSERPGLEEALGALQDGDTLLVWRLDRLGRSLAHLIQVVQELRERGVHFRSLRDGAIDTTTASGELVFHLFAALAQFERRLVRERTHAGLKAAKQQGRTGGRPRTTRGDPRVIATKQMWAAGVPVAQIASALQLGRTTVYRYLSLGAEE